MQCSMMLARLLQPDVLLVTVSIPRLFHPGYKVVAWLLQPTFTSLLLGCPKVVTTKYPACYRGTCESRNAECGTRNAERNAEWK